MKKRMKIRGVEGFPNFHILEQWRGRLDGKNGQIIRSEDIVTSPWVKRKQSYYMSWEKRLIDITIEEMAKYDFESRRLQHMIKKSKEVTLDSRAVEDTGNAKIRLNELSSILQKLHTQLVNYLEEGEAVLSAHLLAYWKGVRYSQDELPMEPDKIMSDERLDNYLNYYSSLWIVRQEQAKAEGII